MGTLAEDEKTMQLQGYVRVGNNSGEDYEKAQTRLIVGKVHILDKIAELAKRQYPYGRPVVGIHTRGGLGEYGGAKYLGDRFGMDLYDVSGDSRIFDAKGRMKPKEIKKEGLSEYFLYSIEGTEKASVSISFIRLRGRRLLPISGANVCFHLKLRILK
jgi:hypothetical protein